MEDTVTQLGDYWSCHGSFKATVHQGQNRPFDFIESKSASQIAWNSSPMCALSRFLVPLGEPISVEDEMLIVI